jgi:hypothetical protein
VVQIIATIDVDVPADTLHAIIEKLEQFAWTVSAANRSPANR